MYSGALGYDGSSLSMPSQVYTKALCVIEVDINLLHFQNLCGWFLMPIMMRNKVISSLERSCLAQGCDSERGGLLFTPIWLRLGRSHFFARTFHRGVIHSSELCCGPHKPNTSLSSEPGAMLCAFDGKGLIDSNQQQRSVSMLVLKRINLSARAPFCNAAFGNNMAVYMTSK